MTSRMPNFLLVASLAILALIWFDVTPYSFTTYSSTYPYIYFEAILLTLLLMACLIAGVMFIRRVAQKFIRLTFSASMQDNLESQRTMLLKLATSDTLHSAAFDKAIHELLHIVTRSLLADKVEVWLFSKNLTELTCCYLFEKSPSLHANPVAFTEKQAPLFFSRVRSLAELTMNLGASDPLIKELHALGGKPLTAMLNLPLTVHGNRHGIVCVSYYQSEPKRLTASERQFARTVADTLAMTFEVYDRKQVEAELARKSKAIEAALDGIAIVDARERISFANQALATLFGRTRVADLVGRDWQSLFSPVEVRRITRCLKTELRKRGHARLESSIRNSRGEKLDYELSLTALGEGDFVCVVRDITPRKRAEHELTESKMFLRKVIDTDPNFIFVKDIEGRFFLVNQSLAEAYGASADEIVGKTDADFNANAEEVSHFRKDDSFVIQHLTELVIPEEKVTDSTGRTRWLQTVKRPLHLPGQPHPFVLGVAADITDRKLLQDQLVQSQKMEAVGQLAGGIAHDFNNMMTGILGYTSLLKLTSEKLPTVLKHVELIERAALRASELTQKLLGFARRGKHQNIPINIHTSIRETVALLARTIERNIKITLKLKASNPFIRGDPTQIQQVIVNLALNARDAIRMNHDPSSVQELSIRTSLLENTQSGSAHLELSVSDTGCGIAPEHLHRVFEPFFTTKEEGKGTGMGLAMVYGIVENHDGSIRVKSTIGEGSTFTLQFPSMPAPLAEAVEKTTEAPRPGKGQILIVDDHTVVREVTAQMLGSLGYRVVTARDGLDALDYYRENQSDIDLVVLDLIMPRMGARECFQEIKKINPHAKAILSTGYVNNNAVQELLNEGIMGFVQKPYQLSRLSEIVADALKQAR